MTEKRASGIHDFIEKRVFQMHVSRYWAFESEASCALEPLHADARGRFGVSVTPLNKRRADDRHQD